MTNQLYDNARYRMVTGHFDWPAIDLVLTVWSGTPDYVQDDEFISEIVARGLATPQAHSQPVTFKSVAPDGTVQTNQVVVQAVPVSTITWFTLSMRAATVLQSELLYYVDVAEVLPFASNGLDMVVNPDWVQARGWFRP